MICPACPFIHFPQGSWSFVTLYGPWVMGKKSLKGVKAQFSSPQTSTTNSNEKILTGTIAPCTHLSLYLQPDKLGLQDPSKQRDEKADRALRCGAITDVSAVQSLMPNIGMGARGKDIKLKFSDEELEDVLAVTEYDRYWINCFKRKWKRPNELSLLLVGV